MPAILRLQHVAVTVPTEGLERARAFYSGVLGLREVPRPPEIRDRPGIWYSFGSTELHIQARTSVPEAGDRHPALIVDDIDAWKAHFLQHGVEVIDQPTIYGRRRFDVRDPFGNRIELTTEGEQL
ncbi:MAG TPA: VOC family protein [Dehalococcoidia bacterium]|nr:VOC family protein [Dehalococcoidia bacterium]